MPLDETVLKEMRDQYQHGMMTEANARAEFDKDMSFFLGDGQWNATLKAKRDKTNRPCLTINLLPEKVQQIVNATKMNKPAGKVSPVEDADQDTAEVMQGLGRHIEYMSQGQLAYNTAYEHACIGGFGVWRYNTQYVDDDSLDQELIIEPIYDPLCVICDPDAKHADGSDAKFWFVVDWMNRDVFKRQFPKAEVSSAGFATTLIERAKSWFRGEDVMVVEYWRDEQKQVRKVAIATREGKIKLVEPKDIPEGVEPLKDRNGKVRERDVTLHNIVCYKTNGIETLDEQPWAGRYIPLVRVTGKRLIHKGKVYYISAIRNSRDPQIMLNYSESSATEATMLSTKAPWIGWKGQFKDPRWKDANLTNYAYLELEPVQDANGQTLPAPQRNIYEPPIQAVSMIAMRAEQYVKSTTGLYNPSLGSGEEQRSGKAVSLLQRAGDLANYHLFDNLVQAIWQGWRITLDMIPRIYDTERQVRILGNDESQKIVKVNAEFVDEAGQPKVYNLGAGKFDVTVEVGPAFNTMRQEASANMQAFANAVPELVPRWADLYVKAQDWPMKNEIAERITPPEFASKDGQKNPIPPQLQQAIAQRDMMIQRLTEELNSSAQALEQKKLELESKERIAAGTNKTDLIVAELKASSTEAIAALREEIGAINQRLTLLHANEQQVRDQEFQAAQSAQ